MKNEIVRQLLLAGRVRLDGLNVLRQRRRGGRGERGGEQQRAEKIEDELCHDRLPLPVGLAAVGHRGDE